MKRIICLLLLVLLLCGCQKQEPSAALEESAPQPVTIGLCLPGRGTVWREQANRIAAALEAQGFRVLIQYGSDDVLLQQSQIESLLGMPVDCLVLGAYDPLTVCDKLEGTSVPVLAYDRMLQFFDGVDGFVMPDYYDAGVQLTNHALAQYPDKEQLTVELMMGVPQDPNSLLFYQGIMSVLQPLIDSGKVVCLSGRIQFEDVYLEHADLESARDICFDYLAREYENTFPDIFITGNDAMAEGCIQALEGMAFSPEEAWPVVIGLGGTEDGLLLLEDRSLTATATVDQEALTDACVSWVLALLEGQVPEGSFVHNGVDSIPGSLQKMRLLIGS